MLDLLPYNIIPCEYSEIIANKTLEYLHQKTDLLENRKQPWNFLSESDFLKSVPELIYFCKQHSLFPQNISVTILNEDLDLHVDEKPIVAKINFPVSNTAHSNNYWIHVPQNILDKLPVKTNDFNKQVPNLKKIRNLSEYKVTEHQNFNQPIVFNSAIPHGVRYQGEDPRIVLSVTFFNEPIEYLRV